MHGWLDHIVGAESDSGLRLEVTCPSCGQAHLVALTRLDGRFAFSCGEEDLAGKVTAAQWQTLRGHGEGGNGAGPTA